ncbi:hypothetical protein LTR37_004826 [Vermiconidia calcicola]|uniref:Uncharacterized protein n=1 Tax=Vermiconidia calcicola TaxID=1690605 RepID=A0ACC3NP12_9PEZI|nr:hypothetical protein LTR37_004826 [Vermiconidia calcicola]
MKAQIAAAAAVAAVGARAQAGYKPPTSHAVSYSTVTVDDCSTMPMETMITITNGVTVTYCPECEHDMTTKPHHPGYTTTYTTTYMSLCPTGMVPATYTITESCDEPEPTWTPGPSHVPQGFTVTEKVCDVCDKTPTTVTVTEPCDCEAHEGTPAPNPSPKPTSDSNPDEPGTPDEPNTTSTPPSDGCDGDDCGGDSSEEPDCTQIGDGQVQCSKATSPPKSPAPSPTAACSQIADGQVQCDSATAPASSADCSQIADGQIQCNEGSSPSSGGSAPPYPTPTTDDCSGPGCRAKATGGSPSVTYNNNTTPITPSTGAAQSSFSSVALISSTALAVIVAVLAFAL